MFQTFKKNTYLFLGLIVYLVFLLNDVTAASPHICLVMIVKNESHIIERCLTNAKNLIDSISICDTGSKDNTVEIIEDFMQKNQIPGKVHRHEWKNFGHNRTLSVQAAKKMLQNLNIPLSSTYFLLLDADMILKPGPQFQASHLTEDSYLILQKSSGQSYYNTRLIRGSLPWESVGVTHEYWSCPLPHQRVRLETIMIDDQNDGGCKTDKFERDLKLLTQGLKEEPDNERYMFYCAQTHKSLKQYEDAIRWYKARIEKGGWKEEVWFSKFMIGECYEEMGFWDHALHWYLDAYQYNPDRAETLSKIARYYRFSGKNDLAYLFASHGSRISYPQDQILFVSHPVYEYQFDEDLSIAAYYTRFKEEGYTAINRLLLKRNVPQFVKEQAYKNALFYVENLKNARFFPLSIALPLIREGSEEHYFLMNPSIQKVEDGYQMICRTVNFSQKGGTEYRSRDPLDETIRTRNFLVHYDRDFKRSSQKEIIEDLPRPRVNSRIQGLEDCRLILFNKELWFLGTTYDISPNTVVQSLCKLADPSTAHETIRIEKLIPLKGPILSSCEKNWLPFIKEGKFHAIYSSDPFVVYQIDHETGNCEMITRYEPTHDFSRFRGSAGPIEFDNGFLMLIHEVTFNNQRYYTHRFVYLDKDFIVKKLSKPFTFLHQGIEYCCGMITDHSGTKCLMPIGFEDREAYLCFMDLDAIRSLLEPLP